MSAATIIEGITAILSEQAKVGRREGIIYDDLRVEVEAMGHRVAFRVNGGVGRTVRSANPYTQQAPAPDAEQQAPAPDAPPWDQEPLLDMGLGQGKVTVMARWLMYKKLLRERPDVALLFLVHVDATATVSWPTIRPPATGGAMEIPFALCCWYLEQVDRANDGRLEAALAWLHDHFFPKRRGRPSQQDAGAPERQDGTRRDAEGDKPRQSKWTPPPGFAAYLAGLRGEDALEVIAHRAHLTVPALKKLEKGTSHKQFPRHALMRLAAVYKVSAKKMLKEAGDSE